MSSSSESDAVDASDAALLRTVNVAASMVSLFASLLVCFSYLRWSELRSFAFRLVFFLVLSDALYALGNLLNDPATGTLCYLQSVIISFFGLASVLWSACIAFSLHMAFQHERFEYEENMPTYHLVVWGLSALMTVLPLFTHSYGINNGWCWISQGSEYSTLWRFVQLYIPIWVSIFYSCWVQVSFGLCNVWLIACRARCMRLASCRRSILRRRDTACAPLRQSAWRTRGRSWVRLGLPYALLC